MIGIWLGVWALIVVLSVMNGFQKEVRTRILGVVSHVQVTGPGGLLAEWRPVAQAAAENPHVVATAPFVQGQAMFSNGRAVRGVRIELDDLFEARAVARELTGRLPGNAFASDWTRSHANFFRAVEIEKRMMFIILALIILVAAINIISTMVMAVTDKQADIAILRTLGAAPGSVMQIFIVQGMVIGIAGTLIGAGLGIITALNIDVIVPAIDSELNITLLSKDVYLIPELPSDLQAGDVGAIVLMALGLSFFATLYPSWRAAL